MNRAIRVIAYGFMMWLIPFIVSLVVYPIKTSFNPLFESIMPVVITITAVVLAVYYFNGVITKFLREGFVIGVSWFFICIIIDLFLFLPASPMQMSLSNYMMDIGLTYLIISSVTVGMSYMGYKF